MQSGLGLNSNPFHQPNLSLDMNISHILEENDINQSVLNFNPSDLVTDNDNNHVDYSAALNHNANVLRQFNDLHISGSNLGYKKEMVINKLLFSHKDFL